MNSSNQSYRVKRFAEDVILEYLFENPDKSMNQISKATGYNIADVNVAVKRLSPILDEKEGMLGEGEERRWARTYSINLEKVEQYRGMEEWRTILRVIQKYKKPKGSSDIPTSLRRQIEDRKKRRDEFNRRMYRERVGRRRAHETDSWSPPGEKVW